VTTEVKNPEKICLGAQEPALSELKASRTGLASETWVGYRYAFSPHLHLLTMSPEPENR
jgi:hypothetical protein